MATWRGCSWSVVRKQGDMNAGSPFGRPFLFCPRMTPSPHPPAMSWRQPYSRWVLPPQLNLPKMSSQAPLGDSNPVRVTTKGNPHRKSASVLSVLFINLFVYSFDNTRMLWSLYLHSKPWGQVFPVLSFCSLIIYCLFWVSDFSV